MINWWALGILVALLFALRSWRERDQWHHGYFALAAFDLPDELRVAAIAVAADDLLQHLLERLFGIQNGSPLKLVFILAYRAWRRLCHVLRGSGAPIGGD